MNAPDRRAVWRDLVERRLPEAARGRRDWPVRLDHCFARILLDHACGGPWRDSVPPPAHANLPPVRLEAAIALGEAVLAGQADLRALNRRSLAWRGKLRAAAVPPASVGSTGGNPPHGRPGSASHGHAGVSEGLAPRAGTAAPRDPRSPPRPHPRPRPVMPASAGLDGALQGSLSLPEPSFEGASPHPGVRPERSSARDDGEAHPSGDLA